MTQYTVTWEINIDAETPEAAALEAWEAQRPGSEATVFTVQRDACPSDETVVDVADLPEALPAYMTANNII